MEFPKLDYFKCKKPKVKLEFGNLEHIKLKNKMEKDYINLKRSLDSSGLSEFEYFKQRELRYFGVY